MENTEVRTAKIAELNDECRHHWRCDHVLVTNGVRASGDYDTLNGLYQKVREDEPTPLNDPYSERDFGCIHHHGTKFFWKIDYYDLNIEFHSPDPADAEITHRVLTIMRADEY